MKLIRKNIPAAVCFALAFVLLAFACAGSLMSDADEIARVSVQVSPTPQPTRVPDGSLSDASQIRVVAATAIPTQSVSSFDFHGTISDGKVVRNEAAVTTAPTQSASSFDFHGTISDGKVVGNEAAATAAPTQSVSSFDFHGTISDGKVVGNETAATAAPTQSVSSFDFHGTISDGKVVGNEAATTAAPTQSVSSFDFHGSISEGKVVGAEISETAETEQIPEKGTVQNNSLEMAPSSEKGAFARFLSGNAGWFALAGFIALALGLICMCIVPAIRNYREGRLTDENITSSQRVLKAYVLAPNKWMLYLVIVVIVAILIAWSSSSIEWKGLASKGSEVAYGIVHGITHPDMSYILSLGSDKVPYLMLQTIAIALLGTLIGGILAIPVAFLAAENVVPKWVAFIVRSFVLAIRTIPSIIWALCWVRVTGPGALCGVLTQSICSIGMISKMYITAIEDLDTRILESLDAAGCTIFQKIRYGIIPQLTANFISTIIYRFDINLKDATTLGIVGAGGIGASLIQAINSRRWGIVGSFLCGLVLLMLVIEFISTKVRARLAHGEK